MKFETKFRADTVRIINPRGRVGVVTLWASVENALRRLRDAGVDLDPSNSKIAAIGTLYGEGFKILLRNLLHNPQIDALVVFGYSKNDSRAYLNNFFTKGVEPFPTDIRYRCEDRNLNPKPVRVRGTDYVMDDLVVPETFTTPPTLYFGNDFDLASAKRIKSLIDDHEFRDYRPERVYVELPEVVVDRFPSNTGAHVIVEDTPADAWHAVVFRVMKFGRRVPVQKGDRIELRNLKVVVENPHFETGRTIIECGFQPEEFRQYQREILSADMPRGSYTYGHRMRAYFGIDAVGRAVDVLRDDLDDRKGYITLWDNTRDIGFGQSPCLVSLFFRKDRTAGEPRLHLTATYRTHNVAKAWYENLYGLMAVQEYVSNRLAVNTGTLTVISHSITLDPSYLEKARSVFDKAAARPLFKKDPNGYFRLSIDGEYILVVHYSPDNVVLGQYRGKKPVHIQRQIARDLAISDINHAIYMGRQLQKAYDCIRNGSVYIQD